MPQQRFLYLSRADVERVGLDLRSIIDLLERAFREKAEGRVEMPPKPGIHPRPDAFLHAMAASIPGMQAAGLKWVAGFPENTARGLPYVSGLLILNDVETGLPLAVMDATWITAYRTGAACFGLRRRHPPVASIGPNVNHVNSGEPHAFSRYWRDRSDRGWGCPASAGRRRTSAHSGP